MLYVWSVTISVLKQDDSHKSIFLNRTAGTTEQSDLEQIVEDKIQMLMNHFLHCQHLHVSVLSHMF